MQDPINVFLDSFSIVLFIGEPIYILHLCIGSNAITEGYKQALEYFPPSTSKDDFDDDFTPSSVDEMFSPSHNDVNVAAFYT